MKLVADRRALHAALQHVGSVITSTVARPIYQNVKLEASDDGLFLSATDLEVGLRVSVSGVEIQEKGAVLLPQGRIASIVGATPDETVGVAGDESAVTISSSDGVFRILAESPQDFADVPELSDDGAIEMDPEVLHYMVRRTAFAVADARGRYALNGILLVVDEQGNVEMAATDGARLANVRKKVANAAKKTIDCIVMKKGLEQASRMAAHGEDPVRIQVTDTQFLAESKNGRLCCQLVEGQFPNFREVLPRSSTIKVELPTKPLLSALTRASFMASEQSRAVDFALADGLLTLTSQSPDVGEAEIRIAVDYKGDAVSVAFNPTYIEEMLKIVERESVKFEFTDPRSPCLFKSGTDYQYVVSPVVREE